MHFEFSMYETKTLKLASNDDGYPTREIEKARDEGKFKIKSKPAATNASATKKSQSFF